MGKDIDIPADYITVLEAIKDDVRTARRRTLRVVNTELLELYWRIGRTILDRQATDGWGSKVIQRLSHDLRREFADMTGLSPRNLQYMTTLASSWPQPGAFAQQAAAQMPWGHLMVLLDKLSDADSRDWYAAQAVEYGWSRNVLVNQIKNQTHRRAGAAPSNFTTQAPPAADDVAAAMQEILPLDQRGPGPTRAYRASGRL